MMEIQVTIKAPDLSEAINNLAAALSGTDRCTAIKEAPKSETYDLNKLPQNMPHVAPVVQPAATPVVQAPVAPVAPAPVAQTATPAAVTAPAQREYKLDDLAERAGTEEIREFAEIFRIAKRGGGNMTEILSRTAALIEERLDVENEISIMLGNRRLEQRIMDVTPFMIIFYIGITSPGFFDVLYHNPEGIAFMTLCLGAYLCALALSEKILAVTL